jgi:hypothetical protein
LNAAESDIDTANRFMVACQGDLVIVMAPPMLPMTRDFALNLAAYLVCMADPLGERFAQVLKAVQST